jgi:hypothetical protein
LAASVPNENTASIQSEPVPDLKPSSASDASGGSAGVPRLQLAATIRERADWPIAVPPFSWVIAEPTRSRPTARFLPRNKILAHSNVELILFRIAKLQKNFEMAIHDTIIGWRLSHL